MEVADIKKVYLPSRVSALAGQPVLGSGTITIHSTRAKQVKNQCLKKVSPRLCFFVFVVMLILKLV
jgi:hypothetical protein